MMDDDDSLFDDGDDPELDAYLQNAPSAMPKEPTGLPFDHRPLQDVTNHNDDDVDMKSQASMSFDAADDDHDCVS